MTKPARWSDRTARPSGCVISLIAGAAALTGLARMFAEVLS